MYRVFFPLSFCQGIWFSTWNSKILSFLESSWNYLELWNSSGNGLFIAKFDIEGINWTCCNDFSHIWEHLLFFETCKPDIQKCWNPLDLACYYQCQCIWYFSHSIFVLELDFQCRISKFHHSWNLPGITWNSNIVLESAVFCQIWHFWYQFNLIFVTELEFGPNNWEMSCLWYLWYFLDFDSRIPEMTWNWLVLSDINM